MKAEIRMAIREEGEFVVARLVLPSESLEQATVVATIRKTAADLPGVFEAFTGVCTRAVRSLIEDVAGVELERVEVRVAPGHERAH